MIIWRAFCVFLASRTLVNVLRGVVHDLLTYFGQLGVVQKVRTMSMNESAKCQSVPPAENMQIILLHVLNINQELGLNTKK